MIQLLVLVVALAASARAADSPAELLSREVKKTMTAEWAKAEPKTGEFHPESSYAFPASWPDDGRRATIYFYADVFDPARGVSDGRIRASVWGKILVDRASGRILKYTRLAKPVKELGIQGVRPLRAGEIGLTEKGDILARGAPAATAAEKKDLRDFYCFWRSVDGVIAGEIEPHEKKFFRWLDCASWKPTPQR